MKENGFINDYVSGCVAVILMALLFFALGLFAGSRKASVSEKQQAIPTIEVFEDGSFRFQEESYCVPGQLCDGELLDLGEYWNISWGGGEVHGEPNGATAIWSQNGSYTWEYGPGYGPYTMFECEVVDEIEPNLLGSYENGFVAMCNGATWIVVVDNVWVPGWIVRFMGTVEQPGIVTMAMWELVER